MKFELLPEVICLVAEQSGVSASRITAGTRVGEDLGVDGGDATEFFTAFASRFHVDLGGFEFARHFGPEAGWSPIGSLVRLSAARGASEPVTVGQLVLAAETGVWIYSRIP